MLNGCVVVEPGASVNIALGEEKSLCPGAVSNMERGREGALSLCVREREPLCLLKGQCKG